MKSTACFALLLLQGYFLPNAFAQTMTAQESRIIVNHDGWELIGDLRLPDQDGQKPVVLMLNQADGDRMVYEQLAIHLSDRGVASLRIDLRGHGESTNIGAFVPGEHRRDPLIWDAEQDVVAVHDYLKSHVDIDASKIAIVGASYSGEEMAEAARLHEPASAYVALSPGSFSEASIANIDESGVPWLLVTAKHDRFLQEITASIQAQSEATEIIILPGRGHATNLLQEVDGLAERLAVWLAEKLG